MSDLLLCTLGASWAVIPETLAFLDPDRLPLYAHHPQRPALEAERAQCGLRPPQEVWIITTEGRQTRDSLARLAGWCAALGERAPRLRVWQAQDTDQLATQDECTHLRELTLRLALLAQETAGRDGQCVYSLAGGRKTMSADLQRAATVFGADALLHVVGTDPLPAQLRSPEPALLTGALPPELAQTVLPLVVERDLWRSELLDIVLDAARGPVCAARFPLPLAPVFTQAQQTCRWRPEAGTALGAELAERERDSGGLLGNYLDLLARDEKHENWRQLYRLPPADIEALRQRRLTVADRDWLQRLPKADLHRHLGGCLDLERQIEVGRAVRDALDEASRAAAQAQVGGWIGRDWPADWPQQLRATAALRSACVALLLAHETPQRLAQRLFPADMPRLGLKHSAQGFAAYERPGELSGSAILQHPAAIGPYAAALVAQARDEGLAYVELRGSPQKYLDSDGIGFLRQLHAALEAAGAHTGAVDEAAAQAAVAGDDVRRPVMRFLVIADRRRPEQAEAVAALILQARHELPGFVVGLDLAGDEAVSHLDVFQEAFAPVFAECVPVTIHAGEGEPAHNIWKAAYELHADRIGHGLTLHENPALAARFRNRGIAIELCPGSNREVVGYHDPDMPQSTGQPAWPLPALLAAGLPLTLCTDNPGISRTTLADEYLAAARMSAGGLSRWQALALIRQGFVHAFLEVDERERLLKAADRVMRRLATDP